jgi:translation initiation factor IF-2
VASINLVISFQLKVLSYPTMNVSELSRRLKTTTKELLDVIPAGGFDIGRRAIKVDDRIAHRIIQQWPRLLSMYRAAHGEPEVVEVVSTEPQAPKLVSLPPLIRVKDFATRLNVPISKVMAQMMKNGVLSAMNELIDFDTASVIATDLGFEVSADTTSAADEKETTTDARMKTLLTESDATKLQLRAPVVVVMGHVDHGKTKLLDMIRTANVIDTESGGITQHIGAYQVVKQGRPITFIDTPGHEAFTTMRSRGARVADIAILVVAADDGVQPQTKESIKIIKSAGLAMIVAINKVDKPEANVERVKQDLAGLDLIPEDWGGKTICVPVSAKAGTGIDDLLSMILLVADTQQDKTMANPDRLGVGTIIEARVDKGEGPVATVLVQNGTLRRGDMVTISDSFYGKIRAMKNFKGELIDEATPSMPARILGLKAAPGVGDILQATTEVARKEKIKKYQLTEQATAYTKPSEAASDDADTNVMKLNIIVKADVLGSLEAILNALSKFEHPEVAISIIGKGLGNITDADVERALNSNGVVYGFNVKPTTGAEQLAKSKNVPVKLYDIIYQLFDDVKNRLQLLLKPEVIRTDIGRLKVLAVFFQDKTGQVIGGQVTKGSVILNSKADILRDNVVSGVGTIIQLQESKVATNEVMHGHECGLKYSGKGTVAVGDILDIYSEKVQEKKIISL